MHQYCELILLRNTPMQGYNTVRDYGRMRQMRL
nr:MAG TPA: hypothetical protein [Caudoviricetes sp.]